MEWKEQNYECKFSDFQGIITVFEKKNYLAHLKKRPGVFQRPKFPENIKNALKEPTEVYLGGGAIYYYKKIYHPAPGVTFYLKVIAHRAQVKIKSKTQKIHVIKSAMETTDKKEERYNYRKLQI
ncbi:MAG: hypothetical protein Q8Q10_01490 [bacterium]|nr:hypothetical protein [bacterium]